jgi:hypothetical protein
MNWFSKHFELGQHKLSVFFLSVSDKNEITVKASESIPMP